MATLTPQSSTGRPSVSVVVPFRGNRAAAERLHAALGNLDLRAGDEVVVADNTAEGVLGTVEVGDVRVVLATRERSSYHARNAGVGATSNEWILFLDADCTPQPGLLDAYFAEPIAGDCGGRPRFAMNRDFPLHVFGFAPGEWQSSRVRQPLAGRTASP